MDARAPCEYGYAAEVSQQDVRVAVAVNHMTYRHTQEGEQDACRML